MIIVSWRKVQHRSMGSLEYKSLVTNLLLLLWQGSSEKYTRKKYALNHNILDNRSIFFVVSY